MTFNYRRWLTFLLGSLDSHSPALLDLFLSSDASICSAMVFHPSGNSDHVVVSAQYQPPFLLGGTTFCHKFLKRKGSEKNRCVEGLKESLPQIFAWEGLTMFIVKKYFVKWNMDLRAKFWKSVLRFWDTSTSSQASNCDGVVLENYLDHNFQWPRELQFKPSCGHWNLWSK